MIQQSKSRVCAVVAHKGLQSKTVISESVGVGRIRNVMPRSSNPMHYRGVMDVSDALDAAQSMPLRHFDAQLFHVVRVAPRAVRFEKHDRNACTCKTVYLYDDRFDGFVELHLRQPHVSIIQSLSLQQTPRIEYFSIFSDLE